MTTLPANEGMPVAAMVISPTGEYLFLSQAGPEGNVQKWAISDQKRLNQVELGPVSLTGTTFNANGQFLAITAGTNTLADAAGYSTTRPGVRVIETEMGAVKAEFEVERGEPLAAGVALDLTGRWLITGYEGGINIWDTVRKRSSFGTAQGQKAIAITFSQGDTQAAIAFEDGGIDIYQLIYQAATHRIDGDRYILHAQAGAPLAVQFSPDNQILAFLGQRHLVFINPAAIKKVMTTQVPVIKDQGKMTQKEIAEAYWANLVARLDKAKQYLITKPVPPGSAGALAFNPAGDLLAVGTAAGWQMWDVSRQELLLEKAASGVYALTFSPDGRWFAWGDAGGTVHLWAVPDPSQ